MSFVFKVIQEQRNRPARSPKPPAVTLLGVTVPPSKDPQERTAHKERTSPNIATENAIDEPPTRQLGPKKAPGLLTQVPNDLQPPEVKHNGPVVERMQPNEDNEQIEPLDITSAPIAESSETKTPNESTPAELPQSTIPSVIITPDSDPEIISISNKVPPNGPLNLTAIFVPIMGVIALVAIGLLYYRRKRTRMLGNQRPNSWFVTHSMFNRSTNAAMGPNDQPIIKADTDSLQHSPSEPELLEVNDAVKGLHSISQVLLRGSIMSPASESHSIIYME